MFAASPPSSNGYFSLEPAVVLSRCTPVSSPPCKYASLSRPCIPLNQLVSWWCENFGISFHCIPDNSLGLYCNVFDSIAGHDIALYCTAVICRKGDAVAELEAGMWAGGKNQLSLHPDDLDEDFDAFTSASLWNVGKLSSWCQVGIYIVYVVYYKRVQNESPNEYRIVYH